MPNHGQRPSAAEREPRFPARGQSLTRCPDCDIEGNLNAVGQPGFDSTWARRRTAGCETCKGTGKVPKDVRPRRHDESLREYRSRVFRDPYEEGAMERRRQVMARMGLGQTPTPSRTPSARPTRR